MAEVENLQRIVSHCKEYGFIFPSSEIYDNLGAVYDYGQFGVELKNNIKEYWWKSMVQMHENIVGLDSAIFMHPTVWKASGHVDSFSDPLNIGNTNSMLLTIFAEVFCALLLAMGLLTRLASFVLVLLFIVIIFWVHKNDPLKEKEMAILFLLVFLTTLLCGPGKWSIDKLIGK